MAIKKNLNLGLQEKLNRDKTPILDNPKSVAIDDSTEIEVDEDSSKDLNPNQIEITTKAKKSDVVRMRMRMRKNRRGCDCGEDGSNCKCGRKRNRGGDYQEDMMGDNLPLIIGVGVGGLVLGMLLSK
jgi:hypothetical protein